MMLIPESVTPDGLIARAGIMRERGDESCARHLELAAEKIAKLGADAALVEQMRASKLDPATIVKDIIAFTAAGMPKAPRQLAKNPLEDPELQAHSYSTATQDKNLRFTLYKNSGQRDPLGYMILQCEEIYDVGMHLIKNYDKLENIT